MTCSIVSCGFISITFRTAFCAGICEKPSITKAATASSASTLSTTGLSTVDISILETLSLRSTIMRSAVLEPIPLTLFRIAALPVCMALCKSSIAIYESITLAVLAPTPDTDISSRNN